MAKERKLTVIMSLHELDLAERISDQIACVRGDCIDRFGVPGRDFFGRLYPDALWNYQQVLMMS